MISIGGIYHCSTKIYVTDNEKTVSFGCQKDASSITFNAQINQTVEVRAKDESLSTTGEFFYCLGFQPNGKYAHLSTSVIIPNKVQDYYNTR